MKARDTIRKESRRLRKVVDDPPDPAEARMAYALANALDWAIGRGYEPPTKDLPNEVEILKDELRRSNWS